MTTSDTHELQNQNVIGLTDFNSILEKFHNKADMIGLHKTIVYTKGNGGTPLAAIIRIDGITYYFENKSNFWKGSILDFIDSCKKIIKG